MSIFGEFRGQNVAEQKPIEQFAAVLGTKISKQYPRLAFLLQPTNEAKPKSSCESESENEDEKPQQYFLMFFVAQELSDDRELDRDWQSTAELFCSQLNGSKTSFNGIYLNFSALTVDLNTFKITEGWKRACLPCKDRSGNNFQCFSSHLEMYLAASNDISYQQMLADWSADSLHRFDAKHGLSGDYSVWEELILEHESPPLGFACIDDGVWKPDRPIWDQKMKKILVSRQSEDRSFVALSELEESEFCEFLKHCVSDAEKNDQ